MYESFKDALPCVVIPFNKVSQDKLEYAEWAKSAYETEKPLDSMTHATFDGGKLNYSFYFISEAAAIAFKLRWA